MYIPVNIALFQRGWYTFWWWLHWWRSVLSLTYSSKTFSSLEFTFGAGLCKSRKIFTIFNIIHNNVWPFIFPQSQIDLPYEEELLRNPYSVKHWLRYIEHKNACIIEEIENKIPDDKREFSIEDVYHLYERALLQMPMSYKLWYQYIKWVINHGISISTYQMRNVLWYQYINWVRNGVLVYQVSDKL